MASPKRKSFAGGKAARPGGRPERLGVLLLALWLGGCTTVALPRWNSPIQALPTAAAIEREQGTRARRARPRRRRSVRPWPRAFRRRRWPTAHRGWPPGATTFSSNAELQNWLQALANPAAAATAGVHTGLLALGSSQRGNPLQALVVTRATATDPATLADSGRPTVLLIGQQHGNEPASAEALMVVARELAQGLLAPLLQKVNVILVPRANPDGAADQQRMTANGIDMNRDHLLLKTPEARALARLVRDYRPLVVVDAHEYRVGGQLPGEVRRGAALRRTAAVFRHREHARFRDQGGRGMGTAAAGRRARSRASDRLLVLHRLDRSERPPAVDGRGPSRIPVAT